MQDKVGIHCYVSGLVQGVWFRAATLEEASKLKLTGWVRNLPDGRVEVMAHGHRDPVMQLLAWLKKGPPRAKVEDVTFEELLWQDFDSFTIT
jgi:acylphosphatase